MLSTLILSKLPLDLLEQIFSHLPRESLNKFRPYMESIDLVEASDTYWKYRTEKMVGVSLRQRIGVIWRNVHDKLEGTNLSLLKLAECGDVTEVDILMEVGVDPSKEDNSALIRASSNGRAGVVKLLVLDKRVDATSDNNEAIRSASIYGHVEVLKILLACPLVDPSAMYNEAIRWASAGYPEVVKLLLEDPRVDPSDQGNEAIYNATGNRQHLIMEYLLRDTRVSTAVRDDSLLIIAEKNMDCVAVKILKEARQQRR